MSYNYYTDNGATDSTSPFIIFPENPVQSDNTTDLGISDSIDAANYNYETDSYDPDNEKNIIPYVVYSTGLGIFVSIDAAAASLRLGTDKDETQIIEMGSSEVTTNIYGRVTIAHTINASRLMLADTLNVSGKTTLSNVSTQALTATSLDATSLNVTGITGAINIGSGMTTEILTMGSTSSAGTTIKGGIIKQVTPFVGGGTCEVVVGNATNATSMSTTFNRKSTSSLTPIPCYTIVAPSQYVTQYFDIFVSGSNSYRGGYTYKGCFGIDSLAGGNLIVSSVNTLFYFGQGVSGTATPPVITFTISGNYTATLLVDTSGGSSDQKFITTLIAYPTISNDNTLFDCSITAI